MGVKLAVDVEETSTSPTRTRRIPLGPHTSRHLRPTPQKLRLREQRAARKRHTHLKQRLRAQAVSGRARKRLAPARASGHGAFLRGALESHGGQLLAQILEPRLRHLLRHQVCNPPPWHALRQYTGDAQSSNTSLSISARLLVLHDGIGGRRTEETREERSISAPGGPKIECCVTAHRSCMAAHPPDTQTPRTRLILGELPSCLVSRTRRSFGASRVSRGASCRAEVMPPVMARIPHLLVWTVRVCLKYTGEMLVGLLRAGTGPAEPALPLSGGL